MSRRIPDDYDLGAEYVSTEVDPATLPLIPNRGRDGPPRLTDEEVDAVLDLISYMPHLDAFDFDNIAEFLKLMYIAEVRDENYLKFCRAVKKRFIEPLIPTLPPRYEHAPRRIEKLDSIMSFYTNIPNERYQAAYERGALPLN